MALVGKIVSYRASAIGLEGVRADVLKPRSSKIRMVEKVETVDVRLWSPAFFPGSSDLPQERTKRLKEVRLGSPFAVGLIHDVRVD